MNSGPKTAIFIVGVGAPASLYTDYLDDLKRRLPQTNVLVLEWWRESDAGLGKLKSYMGNSNVILIGHSAGSVLALQALMRWPDLIKKIIMLDSHFLRTSHSLPTVSRALEVMLSKDEAVIKQKVENAYAPLIENDLVFNRALAGAVDWVNNYFDQACIELKGAGTKVALYIGFTNSNYQQLTVQDEEKLSSMWGEFGVDVTCLPMNHFDLINSAKAAGINEIITAWVL